jgi:hypothetical protein
MVITLLAYSYKDEHVMQVKDYKDNKGDKYEVQ